MPKCFFFNLASDFSFISNNFEGNLKNVQSSDVRVCAGRSRYAGTSLLIRRKSGSNHGIFLRRLWRTLGNNERGDVGFEKKNSSMWAYKQLIFLHILLLFPPLNTLTLFNRPLAENVNYTKNYRNVVVKGGANAI